VLYFRREWAETEIFGVGICPKTRIFVHE